MMLGRHIKQVLNKSFFKGKALVLVGARQVGKTTLFNELAQGYDGKKLFLNCDEPEVKETLQNINARDLKLLIADNKLVIIDEAQRVPQVGLVLKRIADNFKDVQLMVTGSSSLDLRDRLNEPLTGRKLEYRLFPISSKEIYDAQGLIAVKQALHSRMIYGSYPDVLNNPENAKEILLNLSNSYLYKDLLSFEEIRKPTLLEKLLVALALQIGSEVSYNELAQTIGSDTRTVEKYIDLLEKCFVVFKLNAFNRNVRTELKKGKKVYFWDNGVRNAILQNFAPLELRNDAGALWENFFITERLKWNEYSQNHCNTYFWRTTAQQEIDFVEEQDGQYTVYEMKWNPKKGRTKIPETFTRNYPVKSATVVTPENYLDFLI
ncbi:MULTISPECIES: ATP-binding protein [unclassified Fibrobacter]|uniref:ATP-binding protein n=1 Tax=unclassified Fibrobacter TaxID=2634177 RepID=UPI000D796E31|nr:MULTISPECIES: ATP-binding protein [unclassified Fibrobacter]PWJ63071.1 hypothetical protein BGX12_11972 [Fibrobacter sp. UWR4]PZW61951.1 hypothetical protein C8E88_10692 [Fibrobacter sp. UWR1]